MFCNELTDKPKYIEYNNKYRKTKKGVLTNSYNAMCRRRETNFSLKEFQDKYIEDRTFNRLFEDWKRHHYSHAFKPTPDRIDCLKNYSFDNLHWLSWAENRFKQRIEMQRIRAKRIYMVLNNEIVKEFNGVKQASKVMKLPQTNISSCLHKKRKTCGGYCWEFAQNYNNKEN